MPRNRISAYRLFLKDFETMRPDNRWLSPLEAWEELPIDQKHLFKVQAEELEDEARRTRLEKPPKLAITVKKSSQRIDAESFLLKVGARRTAVMAFEFVTCSILPLYSRRLPNRTMEIRPMEVCLVRWSIANGCKSVYHVIFNPGYVHQAERIASEQQWPNGTENTTCRELSRIAREISEFVGDAGAVLARKPNAVRAALEFLFADQTDISVPKVLCQLNTLYCLLFNEIKNAKKVPDIRALTSIFKSNPGSNLVQRDSTTDIDTGIYCWHDGDTPCAGRTSVSDTYEMLGALAGSFCARTLPGRHFPKAGYLIPSVSHQCGERVNLVGLLSCMLFDTQPRKNCLVPAASTTCTYHQHQHHHN